MSEPSKPARLYGEKEIGRILERATELQRAEPASSTSSGMTLTELEEVAVEAGIDSRYVRRAALEMERGSDEPTISTRLLGAEVTVTRETVLPGELPEQAFENLLAVLQSNVRGHGQPSLLGRTLTWQSVSSDSSRKLRVVVSSRDGETTVLVEESLAQMAGGLFGGLGGGIGGGVGLGVGIPLGVSLGSAALSVAFPVAWLGLTYAGVRMLYRSLVNRRRRFVDAIFGQLVETARDAIAEGTAPEA